MGGDVRMRICLPLVLPGFAFPTFNFLFYPNDFPRNFIDLILCPHQVFRCFGAPGRNMFQLFLFKKEEKFKYVQKLNDKLRKTNTD